MKLMLIFALLSTAAFAKTTTHERFYRAESGQVLVQGGVAFLKLDGELKVGSASADIESSTTAYIVQAQYGINDNIAVGTASTMQYSAGEEGFSDHGLFIKGQMDNLTYMATYYVSLEDSADDSFYSGGNSFEFEVGYQIAEAYGVSFNYTPEFETEDEDGDKSDSDAVMRAGAYFENKLDKNIIGVRADYYSAIAADSDDDNTNYLIVGTYANIKVASVEFVPAFNYYNYLGENDDLELTLTELSLQARLRF